MKTKEQVIEFIQKQKTAFLGSRRGVPKYESDVCAAQNRGK